MSEKIEQTRESSLVAQLRSHDGTIVSMLMKELLSVKLEKYKDRLVAQEDGNIRGRAQECKDLLNCLSNDLI